jgi:hypothetical protein
MKTVQGMWHFLLKTTLVLAVLAFLFMPLSVSGLTPVSNCMTFTTANEVYLLTGDLTLQRGGLCFTLASSLNNVTFDLGGHTITYDTWPIVELKNPSFELGSGIYADNWDFSHAPDAERMDDAVFYKFGENHTLYFPAGSQPQYVDSDPVNLVAGIEYNYHMMFREGAVRDSMYITIPQVADSCTNERLFQGVNGVARSWWYISCEFVPTVNMTGTIRIGLNSTLTANVSIDLVELRPYSPGTVFNSGPGATRRDNLVLRNGIILQGVAKSMGGEGGSSVVAVARSNGFKMYNMTIIATGTQMVAFTASYLDNAEIYNNTFINNGTYALKRDQLLATVTLGTGTNNTKFHDNYVKTYQTGIKLDGVQDNSIYNNYIDHHSVLPNGYSIALRGGQIRPDVYNNRVVGSGRGIHITSGPGAKIHDNYFDLFEYPNSEYGDWYNYDSGHCIHGIKFEGTTAEGAHVYNNYVRTTQYYRTMPGCAFNMNIDLTPDRITNHLIENNVFVNVGYPGVAEESTSVLLMQITTPINLTIRNNTFITNTQGTFFMERINGITFDQSTFIYNGPSSVTHRFVQNILGGENSHLANAHYYDTSITNMSLLDYRALGGGSWNYSVGWTLTVLARDGASLPIVDAQVAIRNRNNTLVDMQNTAIDGMSHSKLLEYDMRSPGSVPGTQVFFSPYNISVTYNGVTQSKIVNLSSKQTVLFDFTGSGCVSFTTVANAISEWIVGSRNTASLIQIIKLWKANGC